MTTKAYILIETAVGNSMSITEMLKRVPGMKSVDRVTGPYDIIAVLEEQDFNTIGATIHGQIHTITGITRTITCLTLDQ